MSQVLFTSVKALTFLTLFGKSATSVNVLFNVCYFHEELGDVRRKYSTKRKYASARMSKDKME